MAPADKAIEIDLNLVERPNSIILIDDDEAARQAIKTIILSGIPIAEFIETNCHNQVMTLIQFLIANPHFANNIVGAVFDKEGYGYREFTPDLVMPIAVQDSGILLAQALLPLVELKPPVILQTSGFIERVVNGPSGTIQEVIKKSDLDKKLPSAITTYFLPRVFI